MIRIDEHVDTSTAEGTGARRYGYGGSKPLPKMYEPCKESGCERPRYKDKRCKMHADVYEYREEVRLERARKSLIL